ncbi:MAG: flagellar basal body rod protein FlgB [Thermodesulfovibrionales bacterium]
MDNGFRILERLLRFTGLRHGVLASNIANADTPGYRAKDIRFQASLEDEISLNVTNPAHMKGSNPDSTPVAVTEQGGEWLDRNNVELDVEIAKMTENALLYQAGINMLSTKIRMFKNALRR